MHSYILCFNWEKENAKSRAEALWLQTCVEQRAVQIKDNAFNQFPERRCNRHFLTHTNICKINKSINSDNYCSNWTNGECFFRVQPLFKVSSVLRFGVDSTFWVFKRPEKSMEHGCWRRLDRTVFIFIYFFHFCWHVGKWYKQNRQTQRKGTFGLGRWFFCLKNFMAIFFLQKKMIIVGTWNHEARIRNLKLR